MGDDARTEVLAARATGPSRAAVTHDARGRAGRRADPDRRGGHGPDERHRPRLSTDQRSRASGGSRPRRQTRERRPAARSSPVDPVTGLDDLRGIDSPLLVAGRANTPQEDPRTCDPRQVAGTFGRRARGRRQARGTTRTQAHGAGAVDGPCDPRLNELPEDPDRRRPRVGRARFLEVPYQSAAPDIVSCRRASCDPTGDGAAQGLRPARDPARTIARRPFLYIFDHLTTAPGQHGHRVDCALHSALTCRRTTGSRPVSDNLMGGDAAIYGRVPRCREGHPAGAAGSRFSRRVGDRRRLCPALLPGPREQPKCRRPA